MLQSRRLVSRLKGKKGKEYKAKKLDKYIDKLVRNIGEDLQEIVDLFEAFDNGAEVSYI